MSAPLLGELDVLQDVSARFDRAAIPFMLTGSLAMNYYATPRMTRDIDIVAELELVDVKRVVQLFEPDYYVSQDAVADAVRDRSSFNVIEQTSIVKVSVFPRKRDRFRETETARAIVLASFPSDLPPEERRRRLFARLYGNDMPRYLVPAPLR